MFVQFLIFSSMIAVAGPAYNEGGIQAIQDKGFKEAVSEAWDQREGAPLTQDLYNEIVNG